ncbi:hypothetical protein DSM104299_02833 [Baekduia alba]|uniref:hypothetical protein n=1 Tax=Baekduia alba TaxID=2997333 RepID=UPI00233FBB82|nr:hypothetical protein [Baekduia alba]WCB94105.1 hypothetical protein DSM104299_02833 [Baekduia alba]
MTFLGAHLAGIPIEETLLGFAPVGVAGVTALTAYMTQRVRAMLRRGRVDRHHPA